MNLNNKELKKLMELVKFYEHKLSEIASAGDRREREAAAILEKMSDEQTSKALRELGVESVNKDKLGIRVSALREAGIMDMDKLCSMTYKQLSRLKGIGEESAYLIYTVAGRIKNEIAEEIRVRINPEEKDELSTRLLKSLSMQMDEMSYVKEAQALTDSYSASINVALSEARGSVGFFKRLISSGKKKKSAQEAAEYLLQMSEGDYGRRCDILIKAWDLLKESSDDACWERFERNSAAFYARLDQLDKISGIKVDNSFNGLPIEFVREVEAQKINLDGLKATLRSYQDFGVRYIVRQQNVLLGDEMGLGKTVQAIAAMVSLASTGETHFMVVCPASVLVNWAREIVQFSNFNVVTIRGGDLAALRRWQDEGGVAVTTYGSLSKFALPEAFRFGMLVADEAHYIKNPLAKRTQSLLILKKRAKNCLFMTGTPLENRVEEMCFILKCLRPDLAKDIEDLSYFSSASKFREKIAPVYLRRTREDVLSELPALVEKEQWCDMGRAEWESYLLSVMSENFMAMRQVSWDIPDLSKSSKAKRLLQICEMAEEEGRKIIVFSFFRDTISAVCELLGDKALEPITGSVSPQRRQQIVDEFTADKNPRVLLCQVQAGGTGLNIQAASVIVFCEPQLKPSIENQAISRAYRMGQIRSVIVHRLLCDNTVDERIMEILREKQDVFEAFADDSITGSEYVKAEKSIAAAIIAKEKENISKHRVNDDIDDE
jgi:SNF2 family DNA or RNA helicase